MFDRRRYLSAFAIASLVVLRLTIGWHFFTEGLKKIEYDRHDGQLRMDFSAEGFLKGAKGPLADWYHAQAPDDHGWNELLASPRENVPPANKEPAYQDWSTRIVEDWRATLERMKQLPNLTDQQKQRAEAAFETATKQLNDYLAGEADAIAEYRHDLWRLEKRRQAPEAGQVPFVDERIAAKSSETAGQSAPWLKEVREVDARFRSQLREAIAAAQQDTSLAARGASAVADPSDHRLATVNFVVTVLTIAVGVCLLLGLLTRVASVAGALFLLGVIASQPFWLSDATSTMPQVIEFVGLLVLAGTGAGRWLGLDYFLYAFSNRNEVETT